MIREKFGIKVNLYDIGWDVENEKELEKLPKDLEIKLDDKEICEILIEKVNEYLREQYGYENKGYGYDYKSYCEEVSKMKKITFRYKDQYSHGNWNTKTCVMESVEECKKWYGLGIDCEFEILKVEEI